MIGMKDQYFGVEVEMTGITREQAAQALANYGTEPNYVGGGYDKWSVKDPDGKAWSIMSDSSIVILCQEKVQIKNDFFPSCQHT